MQGFRYGSWWCLLLLLCDDLYCMIFSIGTLMLILQSFCVYFQLNFVADFWRCCMTVRQNFCFCHYLSSRSLGIASSRALVAFPVAIITRLPFRNMILLLLFFHDVKQISCFCCPCFCMTVRQNFCVCCMTFRQNPCFCRCFSSMKSNKTLAVTSVTTVVA